MIECGVHTMCNGEIGMIWYGVVFNVIIFYFLGFATAMWFKEYKGYKK